jgi:hypothetical protein
MAIKKREWLLIIFNLAYITGFLFHYLNIKNYEFVWYIVIMYVIFFGIAFTLRITKFTYPVLCGLSLWGLMHVLGGGWVVRGEVLYAFRIVPLWVTENFYVLKYDQFVHCYLYFIMVFVIWDLLKNNLNKKPNMYIIYPMIALTSIGIGALNEIAEFLPVLFLEKTGVGGYFNTAWDIVFNSIGAVLGVIVLYLRKK